MSAAKAIVRYAAVIAAALLTGCVTEPTIHSNTDPTADFSKYRSYGFFDEVTGRAPAYDSFATRYLKTAIDKEMQQRGLKKSGNPQLLVNLHVQTRDKMQLTQTPSEGGYYGYRYGLYGWAVGMSTNAETYTEGTLNVDVVDSATSRLVWEGVAVGRIRDRARDNPQPDIDKVVAEVFARFPTQPAQQRAP